MLNCIYFYQFSNPDEQNCYFFYIDIPKLVSVALIVRLALVLQSYTVTNTDTFFES